MTPELTGNTGALGRTEEKLQSDEGREQRRAAERKGRKRHQNGRKESDEADQDKRTPAAEQLSDHTPR